MEPLVHFVILNYNGYVDTIKCVESIRKIKYSNYKIIVVDNASKDNSIEEIKKHLSDCILVESKENTGFAGGNNLGVDYALKDGSEYVLILNNDTTVHEMFLTNMIEQFVKDEKLGMTVPKVYYEGTNIINTFGAYKTKLAAVNNIGQDQEDSKEFSENRYVKYVMGCCMLIKSQVIKEYGLFDERFFMYLEESDFCGRINDKYKILVVANSVIWHRNEGSTKSANSKVNYFAQYYMRRNKLLFLDKNEKLYLRILLKALALYKDFINIKYKYKDKRYNAVLKEAWKDYFKKKFYRNDDIFKYIK